jgi:rRNA maturation RNase YbeY
MSRTGKVSARHWQVHVTTESRFVGIGVPKIRRLVAKSLAFVEGEIKLPAVNEIHVLLTDDDRIRALNREHRHKDKPTDVLSFPQFTKVELQGKRKVAGGGAYLGDLVISTDTTRRQAKEFGVTLEEELVRLVVHGVLHLCGYDHEGVPKAEAERMRRKERAIRGRLLAT